MPNNMDYLQGKIYTIRCRDNNDLIYVGSTIQTLSKRWGGHKTDSIKHQDRLIYKTINNEWKKWYIELYELYPCNSKMELSKREGEVIRKIGTLNMCVAWKSQDEKKEYDKQYHQANKDEITEYKKQYCQAHKDEITEYKKQYYQANKDKIIEECKQNYENNKDKKLEQMKQYRQANKDKILEQKKQYHQANKDKRSEYMKLYYQRKKQEKLLEFNGEN